MLILKRKAGSSVIVQDNPSHNIKIHVLEIENNGYYGSLVKLGFEAPESCIVHREEMFYALKMGISIDEAREYIHKMRIEKYEANPKYTNHM